MAIALLGCFRTLTRNAYANGYVVNLCVPMTCTHPMVQVPSRENVYFQAHSLSYIDARLFDEIALIVNQSREWAT